MRANIHQAAGESICLAQETERHDYNRHHQVPNKIKGGQKVLLKNQRKMNKKDAKFSYLNSLTHSQYIRYQIRTFYFLIN